MSSGGDDNSGGAKPSGAGRSTLQKVQLSAYSHKYGADTAANRTAIRKHCSLFAALCPGEGGTATANLLLSEMGMAASESSRAAAPILSKAFEIPAEKLAQTKYTTYADIIDAHPEVLTLDQAGWHMFAELVIGPWATIVQTLSIKTFTQAVLALHAKNQGTPTSEVIEATRAVLNLSFTGSPKDFESEATDAILRYQDAEVTTGALLSLIIIGNVGTRNRMVQASMFKTLNEWATQRRDKPKHPDIDPLSLRNDATVNMIEQGTDAAAKGGAARPIFSLHPITSTSGGGGGDGPGAKYEPCTRCRKIHPLGCFAWSHKDGAPLDPTTMTATPRYGPSPKWAGRGVYSIPAKFDDAPSAAMAAEVTKQLADLASTNTQVRISPSLYQKHHTQQVQCTNRGRVTDYSTAIAFAVNTAKQALHTRGCSRGHLQGVRALLSAAIAARGPHAHTLPPVADTGGGISIKRPSTGEQVDIRESVAIQGIKSGTFRTAGSTTWTMPAVDAHTGSPTTLTHTAQVSKDATREIVSICEGVKSGGSLLLPPYGQGCTYTTPSGGGANATDIRGKRT